jgi:ectoine hydroxylase-related dioxygenase (phytanoyl-CoA dioxygenase family)
MFESADMAPIDQMSRHGYVVIPGVLDDSWVKRLRCAFENAPAQASGTQHVEINPDSPEVDSWRELEQHPVLTEAAELLLKRPYCLIGLHGRNPLPGFGQQGLHADCLRGPENECILISAIWMLDDFTLENGSTRVVPGSHRVTRPIAKEYAQPLSRHPDEKIIVGCAGSVLMFNGYLWHSGRRNDSNGPRRAVQMGLRHGTPVPN